MSGNRSNTMLTRILYLKMFFALCMSPIFLAILISRYFMCSFHDKLWSNKTPRIFLILFLLISGLLTLVDERGCCIFYLICGTMKTWYFLHLVTACLLRTIRWFNVFVMMCSKKISIVCEDYWNKHIWRITETVYIQQK